jgi:NAD(P)-dependent dehydrogenase (short-subunit alcohol dehydrogenase family)
MNIDLTGKTALVSGSTAGIGFASAQGLAQAGARVIVNGRTQARVDEASAKIRSVCPQADLAGAPFDLSNAAGVDSLVARYPQVDVLVNNLGIFEPRPFLEIDDADWLRFFETNVLSGVRLSRAYLPGMLERDWGRIIFVSSESALNIPAEMVQYGVTKAAQLAVARGIAETVAGSNVTVNSVLPGPTKSEGVETFIERVASSRNVTPQEAEKEFFRDMRPSSLVKRFLSVDEIANLIVYIASPAASATTGASLRADGGVVRTIA